MTGPVRNFALLLVRRAISTDPDTVDGFDIFMRDVNAALQGLTSVDQARIVAKVAWICRALGSVMPPELRDSVLTELEQAGR